MNETASTVTADQIAAEIDQAIAETMGKLIGVRDTLPLTQRIDF